MKNRFPIVLFMLTMLAMNFCFQGAEAKNKGSTQVDQFAVKNAVCEIQEIAVVNVAENFEVTVLSSGLEAEVPSNAVVIQPIYFAVNKFNLPALKTNWCIRYNLLQGNNEILKIPPEDKS